MTMKHPPSRKLRSTLRTAAVAICAAASMAVPGTAQASPTTSTDDFDFDADGLCAFTVHLTVHDENAVTTYVNAHGSVDVVHTVETDTLTAHGTTVQGLPYHYTVRYETGADGNLVSIQAQGEVWRFSLPDGGVWSAGGRADFLADTHVGSWVPPDDLGPVCDALA